MYGFGEKGGGRTTGDEHHNLIVGSHDISSFEVDVAVVFEALLC